MMLLCQFHPTWSAVPWQGQMQSLARGECRDCAAIERRKVAGENRWRVFGDASCGASFDLETQSVIKLRCFSEVEWSGSNCKRGDTNLSVCGSSSPSAMNGHQVIITKSPTSPRSRTACQGAPNSALCRTTETSAAACCTWVSLLKKGSWLLTTLTRNEVIHKHWNLTNWKTWNKCGDRTWTSRESGQRSAQLEQHAVKAGSAAMRFVFVIALNCQSDHHDLLTNNRVCDPHLIFKEVVRPQLQDHNRKGLAQLCLCKAWRWTCKPWVCRLLFPFSR